MAKNVNIVFNEDGSLLQAESSATGIRQGDSNGEVTIRAVFQNRRNDSYVAKFHFERPDGKKQRNIIMVPSGTQSNEFDYSIGSAWFFAVPGTAKVTVTITDSSGAIAAQGSYSFNVEATQVDVVDSTLTYDEAADLEGLIAEISEAAVKTAALIPLSVGATVTQFFAACKAYYDDPSLIRDGDRMLGFFLNAQGARVTYVGQFYGQHSMIVVRTERMENSSTVPVKNQTFIAYDGLNGEEYHELATEEYVDSFFNADGMANNAVADRFDNTIDLTYETKADAQDKLDAAENYTDILQENLEDGSVPVREAQYANKDYSGNVITATYETKSDASAKLTEAKQYADLLTNEILAGEVVVGKASADEYGRNFSEYYLRHEDVVDNLNSTSTANPLSANQGRVLKGLIDSIQTLLESDDTDLDTLQEIVNYIKDNKDLIDAITITKISYSDIVDNLTTELAGKPLSAKQGVVLKGLIDALSSAKVAYTDAEDSLTSSSTTKYLTANQGKVLKALIDSLERFYVDLDGIAEPYDSTATYVKGDIVAYESSLYKAKVDITTAEAFTIAHWEEIVLTDEIKKKLSKGDYDGSTGVGYADNADQLNSPDVTTDQAPYLFRTSGGDADIGNREKDTIVGGSLGWNQLIANGDFSEGNSGWQARGGDLSVSEGIARLTATDGTSPLQLFRTSLRPVTEAGHKYFAIVTIRTSSESVTARLSTVYTGNELSTNSQSFVALSMISYRSSDYSASSYPMVVVLNPAIGDWIEVRYFQLFDLTACFGPEIADYIYSLETATAGAGVAWFRKLFPKPYYPYKAVGGFLHVMLISHDMVGFNAFNIDAISSQQYATATISGTQITITGTYFASWSIRLIKGMSYYIRADASGALPNGMFRFVYEDGTLSDYAYNKNSIFTPTKDVKAVFIYASNDGTSKTTVYNNVNINLSWSGWRNGQYEVYKKNPYPLDQNVILRGIPKLDANNNLYYDGDRYESSGKVTRRYGVVDLGTFTFSYYSDYLLFASDNLTNLIAKPASVQQAADIFCVIYKSVPDSGANGINNTNMAISVSPNGRIYFHDERYNTTEALKAALTGMYLIYPLATPTEETADSFQETQEVDDFGTEEYVVPEQDGVQVPVGHYTEYPENLRDKLRRLPNMPTVSESTTATFVVNYNGQTKKCSFVPINDWLLANGYPTGDSLKEVLASKEALGGTLRQLLAVSQSVDFANTDYVDLGTLDWSYANGVFYVQVTNKAVGNLKMMSTKYEIDTVNVGFAVSDKYIGIGSTNNYVYIKDTAYTDATAFKQAMKNVLLAYEKASS